MNRRDNSSDSIPMDLIPEILSRLPASSVVRLRRVSKTWKSIICSQHFTELFRTRSPSNPRLLVMVEQVGNLSCLTTDSRSLFCFSSSLQPRDHYGNSSFADFHAKFLEESSRESYFSYASGLFYFPNMQILKKCEDAMRVIYNPITGYTISKEYETKGPAICNPSTGQYVILPPPDPRTTCRSNGGLLGFDPIGKQFKVLASNRVDDEWVCQILTLGAENVRWREINGPYFHNSSSSGICINGVLYFKYYSDQICCFDVRSEKFKFLYRNPRYIKSLINYKGKLCGSNLNNGSDGRSPLKLSMWVLEDIEKEEWSTYAYTLSAENTGFKINSCFKVAGVTVSGEIVLVKNSVYNPFYVFYFNPETNTLRSVVIQGVSDEGTRFRDHKIHCFVDHVEDLSFDVMKTTYAATSIRSPEQSTSTSSRDEHQVRTVAHLEQDRSAFVSVNKFDVLCLLEDD